MGNVHMEATQINYRGGASKMNVEEAIKSAIELTPEQKTNINKIPTIEAAVGNKTDQVVIASDFDAEAGVYAVGDLVMHEGKLYEFTSAHETAGDWNAEEVSEKTVSDEIDTVKSGLIDVNSNIAPLINGLKVAVILSGADRKIKITRSYEKQCFFVMTSNNYHPFFGIISQLDGATDHLQSVPSDSGVSVSLTDNTYEFTLISYFGGLTIVSSQDFTVTAEPIT